MFAHCTGAEWQLFLFLILTITSSFSTTIDNCWNNDDECLVRATLHKSNNNNNNNNNNTEIEDNLPLEIECTTGLPNAIPSDLPEYILRRFERAYGVVLDGCHKSFKWPTYGFEFLPNCNKITKVDVTRFHADSLYELNCSTATFMQVEVLEFYHNEIATVTAEALSNLSLLKELKFAFNNLHHIESGAFDNLHFIEQIEISDEPFLAIKNPLLFKKTNVAELRLIRLKQVTSELFTNLPQTLREIQIEQVAISASDHSVASDGANELENDFLFIKSSEILRNLSIINCGVRTFKLEDNHGRLISLNLSGNALTKFEVDSPSSIEILDLSDNQFVYLPLDWLEGFDHLREFYLNGNLLKQLPLMPVISLLPEIRIIDLRANKLESLFSTSTTAMTNGTTFQLYRLRVRIDQNPWNCKWMLHFAHEQPETFRIFQYQKFLSRINVNGLECEPVEISEEDSSKIISDSNDQENSLTPEQYRPSTNLSSFFFYGNPYEVKRNQRTEALIIVFMLPVGIAVLFILLYLWIYCQKVFHLSFYQKCPFVKRREEIACFGGVRGAANNRFDVVRDIPPATCPSTTTTMGINNNQGYELPLNGMTTPLCNCVYYSINSTHSEGNVNCSRKHPITYVPLPDEKPHEIYEEIVAGEEDCEEENRKNPIYDQLVYE